MWRDNLANHPCRRERVSARDITEGMKDQKEQRERDRELDLRKKARCTKQHVRPLRGCRVPPMMTKKRRNRM